jgi:nucleoside-diphosphate-sugar epimerase
MSAMMTLTPSNRLIILILILGTCTSTKAFSVLPQSQQGSLVSLAAATASETAAPASKKLKYKNVFVAGASKGVGRCIVNELIAQGLCEQVTCLVRDDGVAKTLNELVPGDSVKIKAIVGDAFDQKTVENAMDGCDAAITTLGGSSATTPEGSRRIDYDGNNNVIESAGILGCTRVILVTSIGCGNSKSAVSEKTYEILKDALVAKTKAENILIKYYTNMNWTIVRPGGLVTEAATNKAILTQDAATAIGSIHREDVAKQVLRVLFDDVNGKTTRQIFSTVDPSIISASNPDGKVFTPFEL